MRIGGPGMSYRPAGADDLEAADGDLIGRFSGGDERALEALLDRYEVPLFQFLLGILRDQHRAEDALQETWCRALQHLDGVDCNHLRGWLFTVAYHQAMLIKRRHKAALALPDPPHLLDPGPTPLTEAAVREEASRLRDLVEHLPAGQREVIRQRIYEGKRFREIASAIGCPLNTALARMHEGLKRLRVLWGRNDG
jgi:RNA polymerase sigma-70 factor (ECF subfamily)